MRFHECATLNMAIKTGHYFETSLKKGFGTLMVLTTDRYRGELQTCHVSIFALTPIIPEIQHVHFTSFNENTCRSPLYLV